jgi:hypothetical protein
MHASCAILRLLGPSTAGPNSVSIQMKFFNTAGPVDPAKHYALDPLQRIDLGHVTRLIDQEKYFVLMHCILDELAQAARIYLNDSTAADPSRSIKSRPGISWRTGAWTWAA